MSFTPALHAISSIFLRLPLYMIMDGVHMFNHVFVCRTGKFICSLKRISDYRKLPKVRILVTAFGLDSLWGSLISGMATFGEHKTLREVDVNELFSSEIKDGIRSKPFVQKRGKIRHCSLMLLPHERTLDVYTLLSVVGKRHELFKYLSEFF